MTEQVFQTRYEAYRTAVESYLETLFAGKPDWRDLYESMRYSLLAGGKRIRPVLTLEFARLAGLEDWKTALPVACALELVHTYSLIHDDLPCMDNDDLRRGKPTCHKVYGECNAVLAGDALQAEAFRRIAASERSAGPAANGRACAILGEAAGAMTGICAGQYLDMSWQGRALGEEDLTQIHLWKTAALLKAACLLGLAASPAEATQAQWAAAEAYARELGIAFQIRDDMLDQESTTQELGKPVGSDEANGKYTFAALYGLDKCRQLVAEHTLLAKGAVSGAFADARFLCLLADRLAGRDH